MKNSKSDNDKSPSRRRWLRVLSVIGGVAILVIGAIAVMNLSAAQADGASTEQADADQVEASETEGAESEADGEEGEDEKKKAPVPVQISEIESGTVSAYITSTANLVAENEVKILSEVEGRVSRLAVEEGDFVQRGQVLAALVNDDEQIAVKKAERKENNARLAYERGEDLMGKELISREEYDRFTMEYEIAQQELAEGQWALEKTVIRSPFSGRVSERATQVGQHIRPGDEMFQVTDFDPLIARIFLPERDVIGLEEGRAVRIDLNADEAVQFDGRIRQISPVVDTATGTVKVTVESVGTPPTVRPGSFVTVNIVRTTHEDTTLLPREAVLRELQSAHVFLASEGEAEKREIELGLEEGDFVEALSGVEPGERVIIAGQGGLKDGSPVKILGEEAPEADSIDAEPAS
jgi:membrane fusion protein (multidrug efflux system)